MFDSTGSSSSTIEGLNKYSGYTASINLRLLAFLIFIVIIEEQKKNMIVGENDKKEKRKIFLEDYDDENNNNGGWNEFDDVLLLAKEGEKYFNKCTIERIDENKFGQEYFIKNFAYSKPVIIQNITLKNARNFAFKKSVLLRDWSDFPVILSSANTYSYSKVETTLGIYLEKYLKPLLNNNIPANETFYLFGDIDRQLWKPLLDKYKIPSWNLPGHEAAKSFGIAAIGTGVPFHFHGPGFAEVIFGAKYWLLYPFEKRPKWDPNESTLQWINKTLVNLPEEERPLECLLLPGELIYFPDKWWHATLNVKTSVFFSTFLSPINNKINKKDDFKGEKNKFVEKIDDEL